MEVVVGALTVLGLTAVIVRFLPRDDAGEVIVPPIVENSIAMWLVRKATSRPLGARRRAGHVVLPSAHPVADLRARLGADAPRSRRRSANVAWRWVGVIAAVGATGLLAGAAVAMATMPGR